MKRRLRAAGIHFFISACIAVIAAVLVFAVWYPTPYAAISGGLSLFALLVSIDVVLGPALTAIVANPSKPTAHLKRDVLVIALVQAAAFAYGMHAIALARPVYMVFEVDRFTVVSAADIDTEALSGATPAFRELPWTGPQLIAARRATNSAEMMRSLEQSFAGVDISMQPSRWIEYKNMRDAALKATKPIATLIEKYPSMTSEVNAAAARAGVSPDALRFLPLTSRRTIWTALVTAPDARVVGYLPVDGFL